jgi:hypothetical protein
VRKGASKTTNPSGIWEPPTISVKKGAEALQKYLMAESKKRREVHARVAVGNRKMAEAIAREFKSAGIDVKKIEPIGLANSIQNQDEMKKYRRRKPPTGPISPRDSPYLPAGSLRNFAPAPSNSLDVTRTPPYDFQAIIPATPPPLPPDSLAFANASVSGGMNYFLDTPLQAPAPSNITTGALVGISLVPTFGPILSPFFGFASLQMSASLFMVGNASSNFPFGYGHSEGSVGWMVLEFDENGNFTRLADSTYAEQYYIDVYSGQTNRAVIENSAFNSQTTFLTVPLHFYQVFVWFWGNIMAAGNQGAWGSQAAGFGEIFVQSMSWTWVPTFF